MTDDQNTLLGTTLDEYRIEAFLGRGGMARVYRGRDIRLERHVAIKVIDAPLRADQDYIMRFEREAQAIAKLEHPHIVRLYRYGEAQGVLYMAMQFIEGSDLDFVLWSYREDQQFIDGEDADHLLRIVHEIGQALDFAHSKSVIHRDVKPSNIMLDQQGRAYLTDFGLALMTEVGTRGEIFGSPHYIAPEQAISSAGAVPQSDIYALGVVLFEALTGQWPFDADNPMDTAMLHMSEPPPNPRDLRPAISPAVEAVILKALAKKPEDRYPTGQALATALETAFKAARPPSKPSAASTLPRRSIPERIALDMADVPLPPPPVAAVTPHVAHTRPQRVVDAPPPPLPVTDPATISHRGSRAPILAGIIVVVAVLLCLMAIGGYLVLSGTDDDTDENHRDDQTQTDEAEMIVLGGTPTNTQTTVPPQSAMPTSSPLVIATQGDTVPPTATAMVLATPFATSPPAPTLTPFPTATPAPTLTPFPTTTPAPTLTPFPTMTPVLPTNTPVSPVVDQADHMVLIARRGEDSLFVVNQGDSDIPLGTLQLGEGEGAITGAEWGVAALLPGQCVTAWKDKGKPKAPDITCDEVGPRLMREGKERFWKTTFGVYFNGSWIENCTTDSCSITISNQSQEAEVIPGTEFELLVATHGDDSLFVVNQTSSAMPLSQLQIGEGEGTITGTEWGVEALLSGQCVTAWKDNKKSRAPDVTCDEVGPRLTRGGKERFWKNAFGVYYNGVWIANCDNDRCVISISTEL